MACLRLSLLVFLACLAQALALAQHAAYDYGFDVKTRVKRQLARRSDLVVQDKIVGGGDVVVRQEIRQLEQDTDLWTLYILALSMMQFTDQESPTSYYGLAGLCPVATCASEHRRRPLLTSCRRDTRNASPHLGRRETRRGQREHRLLYPLVRPLPDMAPALHGSVRGRAISASLAHRPGSLVRDVADDVSTASLVWTDPNHRHILAR